MTATLSTDRGGARLDRLRPHGPPARYNFLLSNIDANIAGPGGQPMFLHWFVSIDQGVLDAHPALRPLFGYEHYLSLGMIDGMPRTGPRY